MNIVDSHNHIHFRSFRHDMEEVINRSVDGGITSMLAVGIDPKDCRKALEVALSHKGIFVSVGIHPQNADKFGPEDVFKLADLCKEAKVVAIGETGFDLYRTPESQQKQKELFRAHIELAKQLRLPLVIHDRAAHDQTLKVMDETDAWSTGGVFHCFSGDADLARIVISKGFIISIPGVVTFKNATMLKEVARQTSLEYILAETDAPYLTPEPLRGRRNEPLNVVKAIEEIARIKGIFPEEVARFTADNFTKLFLRGVHLMTE